jgi:hypothetical protein
MERFILFECLMRTSRVIGSRFQWLVAYRLIASITCSSPLNVVFDRSKSRVSIERLTCNDLANKLIPKSPSSLPLISKSFSVLHDSNSLRKSIRFAFSLQSTSHRLSTFDAVPLINLTNEFIIGLMYLEIN